MNGPDTAPGSGPLFLARVYDDPLPVGERFLVERLWPRGVRRDALQLSGWLRDLAPSTELRRWFGHRPELYAARDRDHNSAVVLAAYLRESAE